MKREKYPWNIQDIRQMKAIEAKTQFPGSIHAVPMLKGSLPNCIGDLQIEDIKNSGHFILEEQPSEEPV